MAPIRFSRLARPVDPLLSRDERAQRRSHAWILRLVVAVGLALGATAPGARAEVHLSDAGRQIRFGVLQHDLGGHGGREDGTDVALEYRGMPLTGRVWRAVFSPRPHVGANINPSGETSSLYAGLTWLIDIGSYFYASADFGGAVHNGKLKATDPERAALGSRVLFHEAAEVGVRLAQVWRIGVRIDHMSNADLATPNDGITNVGILFSRQF
jgi:lipid A 3-O-deacylase